MAKGLSAAKAKKILKDGYVKGKPLTAKQIKYFGAIANGATPLKAIDGAGIEKAQVGGDVPKAQLGRMLKFAKKVYDGAKKVGKFDSSIDWKKWVKYTDDFDNNPDVIKHLNEIEETTKANGTWMKNPDGSAFKGTQEEFVIQQSDNFKKAFPNPVVDDAGNPLINYHGSGSKFDVFDESKFYSGTYGKGVYTSPNKDAIVKSYANPNKNRTKKIAGESGTDEATENLYELYINAKNPLTTDDILDFRNFGKTVDELPSLKDWKNSDFGKKMLAENTYLKTDDDIISFIRMNTPNDPVKESFIDQGGDFLRAVDTSIQEGVTPFSNQMKSAKGNILFDMNNPNIYKAIVPGAIGTAAASQMTGPVREDGQFKNGGWLDKFEDGGAVPKAQDGTIHDQQLHQVTFEDVMDLFKLPKDLGPISKRKDFDGNWLSSIAAGGRRKDSYGNLGDLYRYFGGMDLKNKALYKSKYKPTNSKNPNAEYIAIKDAGFTNTILDQASRIFVDGNIKSTNEYGDDYIDRKINDDTYGIPRQPGDAGAIGKFFISRGSDEEGDYISYYDVFDVGQPNAPSTFGEQLGSVKPFEIYDRIYVKKDKEGRYIQKKNGGSLPGASGMMYSRNSGTTPEEPKKAQNGKAIDWSKQRKKYPGFMDNFKDEIEYDPEFVDFDSVRRAVRNVESLDGKLMWNPESTATGLYGQRFSEIKNDYPGNRKDFVKDTVAQNEFFKRRFYDGLEASETTPLLQDANDLYNDYSPQIKNFPYSKEDIAVLSNFIGRGGTRKYLGYAVRDGKPLAEALPNVYGPSAKQSNKTPEEYLELARQYYKTNELKNGGWLDKYQNGGKTQATISQYEEPAWYEKLLDYAASPMTTLGYLAKGQDLPDRLPINVPGRSEFDNWTFDAYNPAAYIKYGASAMRNFEKGEYFDAAFDALGAIPILPAFLKRGKKLPVKGIDLEKTPFIDAFTKPTRSVSGPLPKELEPYLSRRVYPFNKEQEVFESFLSTDRQLKNIDSKSINYDLDGNIVKKTDKVVSNSLNPLEIADQIIPRFNVLGPVGGDIMQLSPLNAIPFYGKNLKGKNMAFRKFGNSIYDVIQRQALSPVGGSDFRMGKNQIVSEGNWAAMSRPSENYSGVFEATFDFNNPFANLRPTGIRERNGVLITDKLGRRLTEIPLTEPGLSFNRRLPFSTRYVPIDKQKLIDDKFQLATFGPRLQSLVEKYGIGLLGAHLIGEEDTYNKYTIDPIIENTEKVFNDLKKMKSDDDNKDELKDGGWLSKYEKGGVIEDDRGQWAYPGEITKINSNNITMKGVNYPVLGISDTGDKKMMQPGKDYKFDGNSVTEYPMAQDGKTIIVDSKNDPRYKAYQDSLSLYKEGLRLQQRAIDDNHMWRYKMKDIIDFYDRYTYKDKDYDWAPKRKNVKDFLKIGEDRIVGKAAKKSRETGINPVSAFPRIIEDSFSNVPFYKKPQQPVFIEGSKQHEVLKTQQALIDQGADIVADGIWGPKSQAAYDKYNTSKVVEKKTETPIQKVNPVILENIKKQEEEVDEYGNDENVKYWEVEVQVNNVQKGLGGSKTIRNVHSRKQLDKLIRKQKADEKSIMGKFNKLIIKPVYRKTEQTEKLKNGSLVELNQLTNFTNYNTPQPGGWLNKYN